MTDESIAWLKRFGATYETLTPFQKSLQRQIDNCEKEGNSFMANQLRQQLRTSIETKGQGTLALFTARAASSPLPADMEPGDGT